MSLSGATCERLAVRFQIDPVLATRALVMEAHFRELTRGAAGLRAISGYRTAERQAELERAGRPTAPDDRSTHRSCPATGLDLDIVGLHPDDALKLNFGQAAQLAGLRWGGGSPLSSKGIPSDWNHVDLGPRSS